MNLREFILYIKQTPLENIRFYYLSKYTIEDLIQNKYKYDVEYELWGKKYSIYDGTCRFYLVEWYPYGKTKIHGHSPDGCIFSPLNEGLVEKRYIGDNMRETVLKKGGHYFIHNRIGYHQMANRTSQNIYSLHVYGSGDFEIIE